MTNLPIGKPKLPTHPRGDSRYINNLRVWHIHCNEYGYNPSTEMCQTRRGEIARCSLPPQRPTRRGSLFGLQSSPWPLADVDRKDVT